MCLFVATLRFLHSTQLEWWSNDATAAALSFAASLVSLFLSVRVGRGDLICWLSGGAPFSELAEGSGLLGLLELFVLLLVTIDSLHSGELTGHLIGAWGATEFTIRVKNSMEAEIGNVKPLKRKRKSSANTKAKTKSCTKKNSRSRTPKESDSEEDEALRKCTSMRRRGQSNKIWLKVAIPVCYLAWVCSQPSSFGATETVPTVPAVVLPSSGGSETPGSHLPPREMDAELSHKETLTEPQR